MNNLTNLLLEIWDQDNSSKRKMQHTMKLRINNQMWDDDLKKKINFQWRTTLFEGNQKKVKYPTVLKFKTQTTNIKYGIKTKWKNVIGG